MKEMVDEAERMQVGMEESHSQTSITKVVLEYPAAEDGSSCVKQSTRCLGPLSFLSQGSAS